MGIARRPGLRVLLAIGLLAGATAVVGSTPPVSAGIPPAVIITTTQDVVAEDGLLSLREAVTAANLGNTPTTYDLQDGATYRLTRCEGGVDEDANVGGDLDLTVGGQSVISGGAVIEQTCPGERVLETTADTSFLDLYEVQVTGGETAGTGGGVHAAGALGISIDAEVHHNTAAAGGGAFSDGIVLLSGATVRDNVATSGAGGGVRADEVDVQLAGVYRNRAAGVGGGVSGIDEVEVVRSTITQNEAGTQGGGTSSNGTTSVTTSTIVANRAPAGANVRSTLAASVTSSIIALGSGGPDCDIPVLPGGAGNNVGADPSCSLDGASDVPGAHPMLAPLQRVPGVPFTASRANVAPSAGVDHDPAPCTGESSDQHGHERPVGSGCDSGAFEGAPPTCSPTFPDVGISHAFYEEICWLDQMGITGGFLDGTFKPAQAVSRQAMAAFIYRLALAPAYTPPATPTFADVGANHTFFLEIEWMAEEEIAGGFEDDTYKPGSPVSRQAMAAFLYRVAGQPLFVPVGTSFSDVSIAHPFYLQIEWLNSTGVAEGFPDGTYRPSSPVSRQAMAAFMLRLADQGLIDGL